MVVIVNMTIISPYHIPILSQSSPQQPLPRPPFAYEAPWRWLRRSFHRAFQELFPRWPQGGPGHRSGCFFVKKMGFDHGLGHLFGG